MLFMDPMQRPIYYTCLTKLDMVVHCLIFFILKKIFCGLVYFLLFGVNFKLLLTQSMINKYHLIKILINILEEEKAKI